jgi:hypothetical protein
VDFPTRVTSTSANAIDNFFIDRHRNETYSITSLPNGLSDHDAQILTLNNILLVSSTRSVVIRRLINEYTIMEFKMNLSYESWNDVFSIDDDVSSIIFLIHT